jgi:hypothetical protein
LLNHCRLVAYTINDGRGNGLFVAFNTGHVPRLLKLPKWQGAVWQQVGGWGVGWHRCIMVRGAGALIATFLKY